MSFPRQTACTCLCGLLLLRWGRWYSIALQEASHILYCSASTVAETYRRQMQFPQDDSAEATPTLTEHSGRGRGRGRSKAQKAVVHQPPSPHDDEQRLVELDSTIAAAEAERLSLQRRVAEKAILKKLQAKLDETTRLKQEAEARAHSLEEERNDAIQAKQRNEILFKDRLYDSQHEVQNLNSTLAGLNSELHAREDELSQYQTENQTMVNELTSLRTQNSKLQRALANEQTKVEDLQKRDSENAFRQAEMAEIAEENDKLKAEVHDQAATIRRIQGQLDRLRFLERQAASQRAMPVVPSMYGPVGAPRGGYPPAEHSFYHGYPPHSQFPVAPSAPMGYMTSRAMPVQPMMSMGYAPAPPMYHFPQSLSAAPSQQVFGSDAGEDAYSEGGSGAVSISPRGNAYAGQYEQATSSHVSNRESQQTAQGWDEPMQSEIDPAQSAYDSAQPEYESMHVAPEVMQQAQEPVQAGYELHEGADEPFQEAYEAAQSEQATYEPVLEAPVDGQAFLAKLQRKGSEFAEASQMPAEPSSVPAVHTESPAVPSQVPPPPVQTSRSGVISEEAAQEAASSSEVTPDASEVTPEANTAETSVSDVHEPAQTEPSDPPTPIYITPLPPGYLATLPTDQQQSHWDAINALQHPQTSFSNGASDLSGKYITPMPPQDVLNNLPTRNQQPSRDKGKPGGQGGQRGKGKGSKAGKGQNQGGHPGEAKNGGNQRSSAEKNGDSQDDAPQPQRKQNKRNNRAKGRNNNG